MKETAAAKENGSTSMMRAPMELALEMTSTIAEAKTRLKALQQFVSEVMVEGLDHDYGLIPGTNKKTLLKPGAEKLCEIYGLVPRYEVTRQEDWDKPLFIYHVTCRLYRGDRCVGEASASSNSRESKYAGRWVPKAEVPNDVDLDRLRSKTGMRWVFASELRDRGISHEGLQTLERTSKKTNKPYTVFGLEETVYFAPNPEIYDAVNTLERMACKRALVGATISVTRSADIFAPDMEDVEANAKAAGKPSPEIPDAEFWDDGPPDPTPPAEEKLMTAAEYVVLFDKAETRLALEEIAKKANGVKDGRDEMVAALKKNRERLPWPAGTGAKKGAAPK